MHNKRRSSHTANLNFRPNNDINIDQKGTRPTSEPTSIGEIFTLMVLYVCKKSLFFNTNLKIAIYLGSLFLVSLIADVIPIPKMYLSRSDNIFNKYLVKFAWAWNLLLLIPFILFTSLIYCCGKVQMIVKHHLLRIGIATFFWWFWTTLFNYIEASYGKCGNLNYFTKGKCLQAGHLWNGFDLSGHSFILIYGSLLIIEETRSIQNWDGIREYMRLEEHYRISKETEFNSNPLRFLTNDELKKIKSYYQKYTPYIRGLVIIICVFQIIWDIMLICTMLYHHVMIEKFLGGVSAIITWFVTYRLWYKHPKLLPKLPGEGIFKYIKNNSKQCGTGSRKQTGNVSGDNYGSHFMGRQIFIKQESS